MPALPPPDRPTRRERWARFCANWIHDLHRVKIPGTQRVLWPFNVAAAAANLRELHAAFARHQVPFYLRDGTALGAYRDGGLIPHDDDIDVGIWADAAPALPAVVADLETRGFVAYRRRPWRVELIRNLETVEISIGGLTPPEDEYTRVLESFFQQPVPVPLLGLTFAMPGPPEVYLEYCYGADWRVPRFGAWWGGTCWRPAAQREQLAREHALRLGL